SWPTFSAPTARAEILTLSLHDALPISQYSGLWAREGNTFLNAGGGQERSSADGNGDTWLELQDVHLYEFDGDGRLESIAHAARRSEEHTSELQSREKLVCRLLLENKKV